MDPYRIRSVTVESFVAHFRQTGWKTLEICQDPDAYLTKILPTLWGNGYVCMTDGLDVWFENWESAAAALKTATFKDELLLKASVRAPPVAASSTHTE